MVAENGKKKKKSWQKAIEWVLGEERKRIWWLTERLEERNGWGRGIREKRRRERSCKEMNMNESKREKEKEGRMKRRKQMSKREKERGKEKKKNGKEIE